MNVLTMDDETGALEILNRAVLEAVPEAKIWDFTSTADALSALRDRDFLPDVAFLDVKMPGMTGLELAKRVKELSPHTNIVFVTAYSEYSLDAMRLRASGYVMKPATKEAVETELENLRFPVKTAAASRLRVQCFGNFEVYADGQPLRFEFSRTKELFAYLVDRRGAAANTGELCCALWEDDGYSRKVQLRKHLADLNHTLERAGAADVFLKSRNSFAVSRDALDCDFYNFLRGDAAAVNSYFGEYMTQYSWAEMTLGSLAGKNSI
jgi:two-component system LytT family response regulator